MHSDKVFSKWVAMWGNAMSISENKPEAYAKNITLRYPVFCPFDGSKIRLTFDNYCGLESIFIEKTVVMIEGSIKLVTFDGNERVSIKAGKRALSDEIDIQINRGQILYVSFYLKDFTQMRSSVYYQGPLSGGQYAIGDMTMESEFDINISRKTNICYFLSDISIYTEDRNKALVCYGDSITAQDWPDFLQKMLYNSKVDNISIIRKATSGSRILRQYSCITYESYGLMGKNRFEHEVLVDGADTVLIQQGINDIIHPVGTEVNPFRPMSDLPTASELTEGLNYYIDKGKEFGYKVMAGTLLPIEGWRTYADFREVLKCEYNDYIRGTDLLDAVIDFDLALRDEVNPKAFCKEYDSGDHLHPSSAGYERMAKEVFDYIINNKC